VRSLLHRIATDSCEERHGSTTLIEKQVLLPSISEDCVKSTASLVSKLHLGNPSILTRQGPPDPNHDLTCLKEAKVSEYYRSSVVRKTESIARNWEILINTPFAKIYSESRKRKFTVKGSTQDHTSYEKNYNSLLYPPAWMNILPLSFGVQIAARCTSGWKFSIEPFRVIPEDSLIFEFCRDGNLSGVQSLLRRRAASIWDRDAAGRTPLWVRGMLHDTQYSPS